MLGSKSPAGLIVGAVLGAIIVYSGWVASTGMRQAAESQSKALDNFRAWLSAYEALLPVEGQWRETFRSGIDSRGQDLVEVARSLRLDEAGLSFSDVGLRSKSVESVAWEGVPVGLVRTCVTGGDSDGLRVTASTMAELMKGISKLSRKDIEIDAITTRVDKGIPVAVLSGLCVLVRPEETGDAT
ncbi:hypothetical protein [Geopseudomonas aromaticivorans]